MTRGKEGDVQEHTLDDVIERLDRLIELLSQQPTTTHFHYPYAPTTPNTTPGTGYWCPTCRQWVPNGTVHYCSGFSS